MVEQFRWEQDSLGSVQVPADKMWGAQTQRSLQNFPIGHDKWPREMIYALGLIKKVAANVHVELGWLPRRLGEAIITASGEVMEGRWDDHFPLKVWQTGSGTHTNMNTNEVVAYRANQILSGSKGNKAVVHPNDHVNMGQSSNDTFPTAMHLAALKEWSDHLFPAVGLLCEQLLHKSRQFRNQLKIGRTHTMDATPMTVGQEFSAYHQQMCFAAETLAQARLTLMSLAQGGTAIGTGLNCHPEFPNKFIDLCSRITGWPLTTAPNKFAAIAAHDSIVLSSQCLKLLAISVYKVASDIRLLASGPRCGFGELNLPANEPGSSIMPGKVNPTQIEALTMVATQVIGNDAAISFAASQGQFQLNAYKPVMIHNLLQSSRLMADAIDSFCNRCLDGITVNTKQLDDYTCNSLMLITALSPKIGYEAAAKVAKHAYDNGIGLREAATQLGLITAKEYDEVVDPRKMIGPLPSTE